MLLSQDQSADVAEVTDRVAALGTDGDDQDEQLATDNGELQTKTKKPTKAQKRRVFIIDQINI